MARTKNAAQNVNLVIYDLYVSRLEIKLRLSPEGRQIYEMRALEIIQSWGKAMR